MDRRPVSDLSPENFMLRIEVQKRRFIIFLGLSRAIAFKIVQNLRKRNGRTLDLEVQSGILQIIYGDAATSALSDDFF
jgi:hypothetical protein